MKKPIGSAPLHNEPLPHQNIYDEIAFTLDEFAFTVRVSATLDDEIAFTRLSECHPHDEIAFT